MLFELAWSPPRNHCHAEWLWWLRAMQEPEPRNGAWQEGKNLHFQMLSSPTELQPLHFFTTGGAAALALQVVWTSVVTLCAPFSSSYDLSPKPSSSRLSAGLSCFPKVICNLICVFVPLNIRCADRIGLCRVNRGGFCRSSGSGR